MALRVFLPGHETHPTYFDENVRLVIANGTRWAATTNGPTFEYGGGRAIHAKVPLEKLG